MKMAPWALGAILVSFLLPATDACANRYRIVDLGRGRAVAINDRNVMAGWDYPANGPARWREGRWTHVSDDGTANDINVRGQIAGFAYADRNHRTPIVWERPQVGGAHFLGIPEGFEWGEAMAISNDGAVVGYFSGDSNGTGCFLAKDGHHSRFLDWPLSQGCWPYAVNRNGQIVGYVRTETYDWNAFIWTDGQFQILPALGGTNSQARGINDAGDVVGTSEGGGAVLWRDGVPVRLDNTDRFIDTEAFAINNDGVIVGDAQLPPKSDEHEGVWVAVRYEGGRAIFLKNEVEDLPNRWHLATTLSVNNEGVIIGYGDFGGANHGFALFPIKDDE
jgi:probable HAF family extracellular repeat protein